MLLLIFRFFPVVSEPFTNEMSGLWDISPCGTTGRRGDDTICAQVETNHML